MPRLNRSRPRSASSLRGREQAPVRPWRANDPNKARRVRESCAETMRYTQHGERVGREGGIAATKQARSANALYRLGWSKERQAKVSAHRHSFLLATTAASLPLSVPPFFILRALSLVVFPLSPRHPPSSRASAPFRSLRSTFPPPTRTLFLDGRIRLPLQAPSYWRLGCRQVVLAVALRCTWCCCSARARAPERVRHTH